MARPIKQGIDYFPLDTTFFSDRKIKRLISIFDGQGVSVYLYCLCEIYRDKGYYVEWNDDFVIDVSYQLQYDEKIVREIVSFCVNNGLFDRRMFEVNQILTSASIQRRYLAINTRRNILIDPCFNCVSDAENKVNAAIMSVSAAKTGVIAAKTQKELLQKKLQKPTVIAAETPIIAAETPIIAAETPIIAAETHTKEKEIKEKEIKEIPTSSQVVDVDALISEFASSQLLCEYCQMTQHISEEEYLAYLERFRLFLHATDESRKTRGDAKRHFLNWLNSQLSSEKKRGHNEIAVKFEPASEYVLEKVRKLYPQNGFHMAKVFQQYSSDHHLSPEEALRHFERAYLEGMSYEIVLLKAQSEKSLLYKD